MRTLSLFLVLALVVFGAVSCSAPASHPVVWGGPYYYPSYPAAYYTYPAYYPAVYPAGYYAPGYYYVP